MTALLSVEGLNVQSSERVLVSSISFEIEAGDKVAIIGESGSGKSLTALSIAGLLPEELRREGEIIFDGTALHSASETTMAGLRGSKLSMVFQEPMTALDPLMRVGKQIAEVIRLHNAVTKPEAKARALALLELVELPDPQRCLHAYPHQLSGGQRQRVVLAMAMANAPQLLICDEPTTALDVSVQATVLAAIERLVTDQGTTLLFITHDLAVVSRLCEKVLVMYRGEIVERGTVAEVFTSPQHPYTAALLAVSDLRALKPGSRLPMIEDSWSQANV